MIMFVVAVRLLLLLGYSFDSTATATATGYTICGYEYTKHILWLAAIYTTTSYYIEMEWMDQKLHTYSITINRYTYYFQ